MKDENSNKLTTQEKEALDNLRKEVKVPFGLKNQVINKLKDNQLITNNNTTMVQKRNFIWVAATITALIFGFFMGQNIDFQSAPSDMNKYILLLYENSAFNGKEEASMVSEYTQWAIDISQKGNLDNAEKLSDQSEWLGTESAKNQHSRVTGYFVILANDYNQALALAKTHPHVGYGGAIELRPIEKLD